MKIACIYLCVSTNEQDIARQADIKAKLQSSLIYPKYIRTVNSTNISARSGSSFKLSSCHFVSRHWFPINYIEDHSDDIVFDNLLTST